MAGWVAAAREASLLYLVCISRGGVARDVGVAHVAPPRRAVGIGEEEEPVDAVRLP